VEEIGQRLVTAGHHVTVYCRSHESERPSQHLGMHLRHVPAIRAKALETLSHTALSIADVVLSRAHYDAAIVFNSANAPLVPVLQLRRIPVAVHVDGLEWKRSKWGPFGRRYYRAAESFAARAADALIADAQGIADYYRDRFGAPTELLTYGAPLQHAPGRDRLAELDLHSDAYHVVVARFEPENHVREIVAGYHASSARLPLVVVGSAPYSSRYTGQIREIAASDARIRLLGAVWDQEQLDQIYANALTYIHGHSVGGTNPSLLRAMGAGTAVIALDVDFNRCVLGGEGSYFYGSESLAAPLEAAERDPTAAAQLGRRLRERAAAEYSWDDVAASYESMLRRLSRQDSGRFRRRPGASEAAHLEHGD